MKVVISLWGSNAGNATLINNTRMHFVLDANNQITIITSFLQLNFMAYSVITKFKREIAVGTVRQRLKSRVLYYFIKLPRDGSGKLKNMCLV